MKLLGNMNTRNGKLYINDFSMEYLRDKYKTPLYIVDETDFLDRCKEFTENFRSEVFDTEVLYASKALLNIYVAKLIKEMNMSIDVVSGGELYTVLKAGFPKDKIYFHGNNKTIEELEFALDEQIGYLVIDNEQEFANLKMLLQERDTVQKVLLRVNPGIEAHTHEYIKTSKNDSKFGESIFDKRTPALVAEISAFEKLDFRGFHAHIGSQIFDEDSFFKSAAVMMDFTQSVGKELGIKIPELNLGGGYGIYYTRTDKNFNIGRFLRKYIDYLETYNERHKIGLEKLMIEPGRSLIANSGSTLYTVGGVKQTYGKKNYIFIDGGMADNIRPALYQAEYEACLTNKMDEPIAGKYTVAGKCCESGDILIKDIRLPKPEPGDLLLVSSTGAYNYSMSSNYNRIGRPAMVFLSDKDKLAVRRQTYEDIIRDDVCE